MSKDKKILTSVYLTPDTKKSFNEICDDNGLIGTRVIEKLIEEWIVQHKKMRKKMYELIVSKDDEIVFSKKFSTRSEAEDKLDEFNSDHSATIDGVEMICQDNGDWWYSGETSINEENAIDVKTFLFGGEYGGPYNTRPFEGWHCLGQEFDFDDTKENFEDFYANVEGTIDSYCWDTENCITVEMEEKYDMCQVFEMPSRVKVKRWYDEQKEKYTTMYDVEIIDQSDSDRIIDRMKVSEFKVNSDWVLECAIKHDWIVYNDYISHYYAYDLGWNDDETEIKYGVSLKPDFVDKHNEGLEAYIGQSEGYYDIVFRFTKRN